MKSAGDEMIRLGVAIGFVCGGCNRSEADVVQNAHGDAKPLPILSHTKKGGKKTLIFSGVMWDCSCRGRWWWWWWGVSCREANLTLQGLGEGGGKCVLYQVGGCWTASRRETSGIDWRYSVGPKLLEHGGGDGGGRFFRNLSPRLREPLWIQETLTTVQVLLKRQGQGGDTRLLRRCPGGKGGGGGGGGVEKSWLMFV